MNNVIMKTLAKAFPVVVLNMRAGELLKSKPSGFHPIMKGIYRRECGDLLSSYNNFLLRRNAGRIIGNKGISPWTRVCMDKISKLAK